MSFQPTAFRGLANPGLLRGGPRDSETQETLWKYGPPALDLRLADEKTLRDNATGKTSLVTFSRSAAQSPGTYVGSDGLIHDAAVNLALYSEQFDQWTNVNTTDLQNQIIAPDGKQTADKIEETATTGFHRIERTTTVTTGQTYTLSVYFKAAERDRLLIRTYSGTANISIACKDDGTIATIEGTPTAITNEDAGNGWRRCSLTYVVASGTTGYLRFGPIDSGSSGSYAGTAGSGIYIWGAQLEETDAATMAPTAYIKTTSQALAAPRFDHDPDFPYVENLLLYSEELDQPAWGKIDTTIEDDFAQAPDGTLTADKAIPTALGSRIQQTKIGLTAAPHTFSVYAKSATGSDIPTQLVAWRNSPFQQIAVKSITVTNDWQRFDLSVTPLDGTAHSFVFGGANTFSTGEDVLLWGAQLETGSSVGQYVKTEATTRKSQGNVTTNLQIYSEQIDLSFYDNSGVTASQNQVVSPDGKQTAEQIVETSASTYHYVLSKPNTGSVSGIAYTYSAFLRKGSLASAPDIIQITFKSGGHGTSQYANFNLSTGAVTAQAGGTATIEDIGGGWYRCSFSAVATATTSSAAGGGIAFVNDNPTSGRVPIYSGSTNADVFAYGFQYEASPSAGPYVRTLGETRSISDANAESLGLLVEEQRANALQYSEQLDNAYYSRALIHDVESNVALAPDGTQTADKVIPDSTSGSHYIRKVGLTSAVKTASIYAKAAEYDSIVILHSGAVSNGSKFDLSTGTVTTNYGDGVGTMEYVGNGWYRCSTYSPTAGTIYYVYPNIPSVYAGNDSDGVLVWGAQLETGTFPTSYIPTVTSQTRYADIAAVQDEDFSTTNLLAYSESFDVGWTPTAVSLTGGFTAPDGQSTAQKFITDAAASFGRISQTVSVVSGAAYSYSLHAKAAEQSVIKAVTNITGAFKEVAIDLTTGAVTPSSGVTGYSESVGNGWYRVTLMATSGLTSAQFQIVQSTTTGDGTSGVYLWGASLTATEYPVDYVTTRNLLTDSQDFERSSWVELSNATVDNDVAQAPDGTISADRITYDGTTGGQIYQYVPASTGVVTQSVYLRTESGTQTVKIGPTSASVSTLTVTTDWQRFSHTVAGQYPRIWSDDAGSILVWGAQLEPGSTATDYVRTVDTVGKAYGFYEPTEGTVFVEGSFEDDYGSATTTAWGISNGTNSYRIQGFFSSGSTPGGLIANPAVYTVYRPAVSRPFDFSHAYAFEDGQHAVAFNGGVNATTTTVFGPSNLNVLYIGQRADGASAELLKKHISRLTYWPTRLTDAELEDSTK